MTTVFKNLKNYAARQFTTTDTVTGDTSVVFVEKLLKASDFDSKDNWKVYSRLCVEVAEAVTAVQIIPEGDSNRAAAVKKAVPALQKVFDFLAKYEGVAAIEARATDIRHIATDTLGKMKFDKANGGYSGGKSGSPAAIRRGVERAAFFRINGLPYPDTVKNEAMTKAAAKKREAEKKAAEIAEAKKKAAEAAAKAEKEKKAAAEKFARKQRKNAKEKAAATSAKAAAAHAEGAVIGEVTTTDGVRKPAHAKKAATVPAETAAAEKVAIRETLREVQQNRAATAAAV